MRKQKLSAAERHVRAYGELILLAGNTQKLMRTTRADLKVIRIRPGERTSFHNHLVAESLFHILQGTLAVRGTDQASITVSSGDTLIVDPGEFHELTNIGSAVAELLEIESPPHDSLDKYSIDAGPSESGVSRTTGRFWDPGSHLRIKICSVHSLDAAYNCFQLGVDAIGIHATGPGAMTRVRAWSRWLSVLPQRLSVFLLTDSTSSAELVELARWAHCDTVQLQGPMSPDDIGRAATVLRDRGWKVVKSVGLNDLSRNQLLGFANEVAPHIDSLLIDSAFRGGTGKENNWSLCAEVTHQASLPVIIAGGLRSSNVAAAIDQVQPRCVMSPSMETT
jgi:phosphoribosylanthranilate isomerase